MKDECKGCVCRSLCVRGAHIDQRSVKKYIGLSGYAFHPVWGHITRMLDRMLENIQHTNPMCTSQTWVQKHTHFDTHFHTCTLADNYPNSLCRAERPCGPHNRFRQGPWHTQDPPSLSVSQAMCLFCLTQ